MADRLQRGIFFAPAARPPPAYRLVLLNILPGATEGEVHAALMGLFRVVAELREGRVRELGGEPEIHTKATAEQFADLDVLVAFGRRLFDPNAHDPPVTRRPRPSFLAYFPRRPSAFPFLPWTAAESENLGEADIALQLTAPRTAAVNCAAVEVWKAIVDDRLPLQVVTSFDGFGRHDGRGWLEFHDGVSNIEASQRLVALEAAPDPPWMAGGTYMAFLRIVIDLAKWRALPREHQELVVGRDKLSGAAIARVERRAGEEVRPVAVAAPGSSATEEERADWREPPQSTDRLLEASHIHRANQNRVSPGAASGFRMFRQGYDFFDGLGPSGPVVGLNFVSFQSDLRAVQHVLHLPGWLGDVNFGGPTDARPGEPQPPSFTSLEAGGFYAVPPREPFPGAGLFAATN